MQARYSSYKSYEPANDFCCWPVAAPCRPLVLKGIKLLNPQPIFFQYIEIRVAFDLSKSENGTFNG